MKSTKILLGDRIRELRKARGLTQEQLAEMVGVEQKHVSRLELGKSFPTIERLEKLAEAFNVPLRDFFDYVHLSDSDTRIASIDEMLKGLNDEDQRIAYKIMKEVIKSLQER